MTYHVSLFLLWICPISQTNHKIFQLRDQHLSSFAWSISLCVITSRSIHGKTSLFLWLSNISLYVCMWVCVCYIFLIHSYVDGHCYLHILAIVNDNQDMAMWVMLLWMLECMYLFNYCFCFLWCGIDGSFG